MNHKIKVGKPVVNEDTGEVVGYDDIQEIASNQVFRWNRRGYKSIPEGTFASADNSVTASDGSGDQDLNDLTVKKLRVIAEGLGVSGKRKADLISVIEEAQQNADDK